MKKHVFIVNAHPDDLIGAAALAFIVSERPEYALHIVDFSHGERGLASKGVSLEECAATRTSEEKEACAMLSVEPVFLNEIDGECCASRETCEQLAELFRQNPPSVVIAHWPVDRHVDHCICGAATLNALRFANMKPEVYFQHQTHQTVAMPFMHYVGFGQRIMDLKATLCRKYVCQSGNAMAERKICEGRFMGWKANAPYAEGYGSYHAPLTGMHSFFEDLPAVTL